MPSDQEPDNINPLNARVATGYWTEQAEANVEEWGLQDIETLLLAMQEEQGELAQAYLEATHEDGDPRRVGDELDDLGALCVQLFWRLGETPTAEVTERAE